LSLHGVIYYLVESFKLFNSLLEAFLKTISCNYVIEEYLRLAYR